MAAPSGDQRNVSIVPFPAFTSSVGVPSTGTTLRLAPPTPTNASTSAVGDHAKDGWTLGRAWSAVPSARTACTSGRAEADRARTYASQAPSWDHCGSDARPGLAMVWEVPPAVSRESFSPET